MKFVNEEFVCKGTQLSPTRFWIIKVMYGSVIRIFRICVDSQTGMVAIGANMGIGLWSTLSFILCDIEITHFMGNRT